MALNGTKAIWAIVTAIVIAVLGSAGGYFVAAIKAGEELENHEKRIAALESEKERIAKLAAERGEFIKQAISARERLETRVDRIERIQNERTSILERMKK
jgi:uncharacterized membrane protein